MASVFPQEKLLSRVDAENGTDLLKTDLASPRNVFNRSLLLNQIIAGLLLIPGLPIIGILILITKMTSKGPGIYSQQRVGYRGQLFTVYKIRTMREDAEAKTGPVWCTKKDPRVTTMGAIFRKLHLDEFPQLFNVLQGDMVLIGPRPERPEFTRYLVREIPAYADRLAARPGITGLAQILLPPDSDVDGVRMKLAVDLFYVKRASFMLDMRILLCTSLRLLGIRGVTAARFMGLRFNRSMMRNLELFSNNEKPSTASTEETIAAANGKTLIVDGKHDSHLAPSAVQEPSTPNSSALRLSATTARANDFV